MKKLTDIETVLRQLKARKEILIKLIAEDNGSELNRDKHNYDEGKLQALTEIIALIEGPKTEES